MPTTTIRLEDDLKERVAAAAERSGRTSHAFILDAIARTVEQDEFDHSLQALAETRWQKFVKTGESVAWEDAKRHVEARAAGKTSTRPVARKLVRSR